MSDAAGARRAKRPRGVTMLVLLFYTAAALVVVSALATGEKAMPGDMASLITLCLIALAWGLWKLYRWAWAATLIMFVLNSFYILSGAILPGESIGELSVAIPMAFIAITVAYLLRPAVRRVYINNGWEEVGDDQTA